MKKRRQWTTYSGSGKRVAPRTRTSRVSRGKEMGVPRLWVQLIVCGALFVALIGLKLLMPGNLSALRGTLGQWLVRDADFISAFSAVGRAASGEQDWGDSLSEAYVAVFGGESKAQEVSGNLIGMTVSEQDVSDLTSARELPALAVGEQRNLGYSYTTPLSTSRSSFLAPSICAATGRKRSRRTLQPFITALPRNTVVLEATVAPASTEAAESEKSR